MSRKLVVALSAAVVSIGTAAAVQLAAASAGSQRSLRGSTRAASGSSMCGVGTTPGTYKHVIVIFMENHAYNTIYNAPSASYITGLANQCGLATNYHNVSHPSLPNYIAATTGASLAQIKKFDSDCTPSSTCDWTGNNIFYQLNLKHRKWRAYAESMPSACSKVNSGFYAPRHNPAVYETDLSNCATNDRPLGTTSSSALLKALASNTYAPAFTTVTPNLCDDMHGTSGCPSNLVLAGNNWLKQWVPKITGTPAYKSGQTAIFITWDEGEPGKGGEACATNTTDQSCHVVTIVVAPSVAKGKKVGTLFNHYSLLKSAEQLLGLSQIGQASSAASMVKPFNL